MVTEAAGLQLISSIVVSSLISFYCEPCFVSLLVSWSDLSLGKTTASGFGLADKTIFGVSYWYLCGLFLDELFGLIEEGFELGS